MTDLEPAAFRTFYQLYGVDDWIPATYLDEARMRGFRHAHEESWQSDEHLPESFKVLASTSKNGYRSYIIEGEKALANLGRDSQGSISLSTIGDSHKAAAFLALDIRKAMPQRDSQEDRVPIRFWSLGSHGPYSRTRQIEAPLFEDIAGNYTASVQDELAAMRTGTFVPGRGGQLLLWHGVPGAGKTWALRALARDWRTWCDVEYIVDPDAFFGKASYLMNVLVEQSEESRWRLLIFEDTGELLSADAKTRTGQGLSRLLNSVDGFIGQGLQTLVMVTTNEELDNLHDAVARPGRAAVRLGFGSLTRAEALAWAERNDVSPEAVPQSANITLAEMYALKHGAKNRRGTVRQVGFRKTA